MESIGRWIITVEIMPLVVPKKPKKFIKCDMVLIFGEKKCRTQCGFCMMVQYQQENPKKKPFKLK
jgi:biotin synthase-like enzyme